MITFKGHIFKSEEAAKWAVFFDFLNLNWEYNNFNNSTKIAPDFKVTTRSGVYWYNVETELSDTLPNETKFVIESEIEFEKQKKDKDIPNDNHFLTLKLTPEFMLSEYQHIRGSYTGRYMVCPLCGGIHLEDESLWNDLLNNPTEDVFFQCYPCDCTTPAGGDNPSEVGLWGVPVVPHKGMLYFEREKDGAHAIAYMTNIVRAMETARDFDYRFEKITFKLKSNCTDENVVALNYPSQAEKSFSASPEIPWAVEIVDQIQKAVHFSIPVNGFIFGDGLKGLDKTILKLPFSLISVSFYDLELKAKVVIMAEELNDGSNRIAIKILFKAGNEYEWTNYPFVAKIHDDIFEHGVEKLYAAITQFDISLVYLHDSMKPDKHKQQKHKGVAINYLAKLCELLEALSCKNVRTEPLERIDPKVNERRLKAGKTKLYETNVIVIDTKYSQKTTGGIGGKHESPRQHLRRAHLRHLQSGRNVAVVACIVGDPSKGSLKKSYLVK